MSNLLTQSSLSFLSVKKSKDITPSFHFSGEAAKCIEELTGRRIEDIKAEILEKTPNLAEDVMVILAPKNKYMPSKFPNGIYLIMNTDGAGQWIPLKDKDKFVGTLTKAIYNFSNKTLPTQKLN